MSKKMVSFKAVRTISKPTTVKFKTKDGETVTFKAVKTEQKPVQVKFKAKR